MNFANQFRTAVVFFTCSGLLLSSPLATAAPVSREAGSREAGNAELPANTARIGPEEVSGIFSAKHSEGRSDERFPTPFSPRTIHDVALEADGTAIGMVVDMQGVPLAGQQVVVLEGRREAARVKTDASGRFILGPLRGGVVQVQVGNDGHLFRVWRAGTEPASARRGMLIVTRGDVLRGQRPIGELFTSNVFIVTAIVAAAIAIPIAVANSKSDRGPSS